MVLSRQKEPTNVFETILFRFEGFTHMGLLEYLYGVGSRGRGPLQTTRSYLSTGRHDSSIQVFLKHVQSQIQRRFVAKTPNASVLRLLE